MSVVRRSGVAHVHIATSSPVFRQPFVMEAWSLEQLAPNHRILAACARDGQDSEDPGPLALTRPRPRLGDPPNSRARPSAGFTSPYLPRVRISLFSRHPLLPGAGAAHPVAPYAAWPRGAAVQPLVPPGIRGAMVVAGARCWYLGVCLHRVTGVAMVDPLGAAVDVPRLLVEAPLFIFVVFSQIVGGQTGGRARSGRRVVGGRRAAGGQRADWRPGG